MTLKRVDNIREDKPTHGDAEDYHTFLKNILQHYEIRPIRDHPVEGRICYLRHDVDWSIDGALQMAQIEAEHEVKSTYYIRPRSVYMKRASSQIKAIEELGHEIGYHHSLLVVFFKVEGVSLETILKDNIAKLEQLGVKVTTVCAHGDPETKKEGYSNYEAFEACPPQLRKIEITSKLLSLEEHGLRAVEFLSRDCFIWDSGLDWQYSYDPYVDDWNGVPQEWEYPTDYTLENLSIINVEQIILLTHPIWWRFYE